MVSKKELPHIIAAPIDIFNEEFERKNYRGALLTIKDCFQGTIKFFSCLLYTDAINNIFSKKEFSKESSLHTEFIQILHKLFAKPPSNGDWLEFYFNTASIISENKLSDQLVFPELVTLVCKANRKRCNTRHAKVFRDFVEWRNNNIGHGKTSHDVNHIITQLEEQKEKFESIIISSPFLLDLDIYSYTIENNKLYWLGVIDKKIDNKSIHFDWNYNVWVKRKSDAKHFSISPLLISNLVNGQYCLLTYDKIGNGYFFLDSFFGTKLRFPKLPVIEKWIHQLEEISKIRLIENLSKKDLLNNNTGSAYSRNVLKAFEDIEFGSEIKSQYVKPTYIIHQIEEKLNQLDENEGNGYLHIVGNAGTGKSWLSYSLKNSKHFKFAKEVLKYHIRIGMRQNPELFIDSIWEQIRQEEGHQVHSRIRFEDYQSKKDAFTAFLNVLIDFSEQERIIIIIDGLDELVVQPDSPSILELLPEPDELPEDVYIILLSRTEKELRGPVKEYVQNLYQFDNYHPIFIGNYKQEREKLFEEYLRNKANISNEILIKRCIHVSKDSFLMLGLLGRLYEGNQQTNFNELPTSISDTYEQYLTIIHEKNGDLIYNNLYLKLFLIMAFSPNPLTIYQLSDISGVSVEKVIFSLFDVGHFFNVHREKLNNTFSIAHNKLTEYILVHYSDKIKVLLSNLVDAFVDDDEIKEWLLKGNENLQFMGSTDLSIHLSESLLENLSENSKEWISVMYSYIDMIHIKGNYEKAAKMYHELAEQLIKSFHYEYTSTEYLKCKIRQAHHLKFVAKAEKPKSILLEIKQYAENETLNEIEFMLYGSIGCLEDPNRNNLNGLLNVAIRAKLQKDDYLVSRCLRRVADLHLMLGEIQEARDATVKAIELAEKQGTRQRIYLYSTEAEINRREGNLEEAIVGHTFTYQYANQRGLKGWSGHGLLGLAETHRMLGNVDKALAYVEEALNYYDKANGQQWGKIHGKITKFIITGDKKYAEEALSLSTIAGYKHDIRYIHHLLQRKDIIDRSAHLNHYLLFA